MQLPDNVIRPLARAGYAARGLVYLIIGGFAVLAAWHGGEKKGAREALQTLMDQPFGRILIWLVVVGLAGYAFWRLIQALFDTDRHGFGIKGAAIRAGLLASCVTYVFLTLFALDMLGVWSGGSSGGGSGGGPASWAAGAVGLSWFLVGMIVVFLGVAIAHWAKAAKQGYAKYIQPPPNMWPLVHAVSMTGIFARGVVFALFAVIVAFRLADVGMGGGQESGAAGEAAAAADSAGGGGASQPGIEQALEFVHNLPAGRWLVLALGLGIMLFSVYSFIEARWRRINVENA